MIKNKIIVLVFLILYTTSSFACSCGSRYSFLRVNKSTDLIVLARFIPFPIEDTIYKDKRNVVLLEVIELIKGKLDSNRIIVYVSDGVNCLESPVRMKLATDTLVLGLFENKYSEKKNKTYKVSACGVYWLKYKSGSVIGKITTRSDKKEKKIRKKYSNLTQIDFTPNFESKEAQEYFSKLDNNSEIMSYQRLKRRIKRQYYK